MQSLTSLTRESLLHLAKKAGSLFKGRDAVSQEVKVALQQCQNMHELLDLLFSDIPRGEAFLSLFEQRIQEIDAQS